MSLQIAKEEVDEGKVSADVRGLTDEKQPDMPRRPG